MSLLNMFLWYFPTVLFAVVSALYVLVWLRHRIVDARIRAAGGVRAPVYAGNIFSATKLYIDLARHKRNHRMERLVDSFIDKASPGNNHCAEHSLTGSRRVLLTRVPEQIKTIAATKFADFGHGPRWRSTWKPFLGDGIFAVDGQLWHDSRAMIRPMFLRDRLRNLAISDGCTDKLISKLPSSGETVDIKELLYRWALDTTTEFILGESVNSLDKANYRSIKTMEQFIEPFIARAMALSDAELEDLPKPDADFTMLHSIARHSRDPKLIRDQIMSVLLAGRDNTAATLSWAFYELSRYPRVWAKLRTEVRDSLGPSAKPSYEALKGLRYLRHTLSETLYLHPPVPIYLRQVLRTTTVPGLPGQPDIALLEGDTITINAIGMHMRRDLYPPTSESFADPAVFSPDRWEKWTPAPWTYLPFHGGPRVCVGQNFALTEMAFCLARLAQRFETIEYRGDWGVQRLKADLIGTTAFPVTVGLFEPRV